MEPHPFLRCGDLVRLTAGPLDGLEGLLLRKRGTWKLLVSVETERSVAVEVDASMMEQVGVRSAGVAPGFLAAARAYDRSASKRLRLRSCFRPASKRFSTRDENHRQLTLDLRLIGILLVVFLEAVRVGSSGLRPARHSTGPANADEYVLSRRSGSYRPSMERGTLK